MSHGTCPTFLIYTSFLTQSNDHIVTDNFISLGLQLNSIGCKSFPKSNSPDIRVFCETNLEGSVNSSNFFIRGSPPLIQKNSITHMPGLAVYVREGFFFT